VITLPGRLVVFEGVEGAGKTTQLQLLGRALDARGVAYDPFREPGGTLIGDQIRALLLDPASQIGPEAEALLFMASRAQLISERVKPALARGHIVLLDRFFLSTYAYQVRARRLPEEAVRRANALACAGLVPDLTVLLRLSAVDGMDRVGRRGAHDRMESESASFHARVEGAFAEFDDPAWQAAHPEAGRIVSIDAAGTPAAVAERVWQVVAAACPEVQA